MKKWLIAAMLAGVSPLLHADEKQEIAKCAAIKGNGERLVCFDTLAEKLGVDKNVVTTKAIDKGKWVVRTETSPIDDSTNVFLTLEAENYITSRMTTTKPTLMLRCKENSTDAFIIWGVYLGLETTEVLTRLDKEKAKTTTWTLSTDNTATFYYGKDIAYIKSLMTHDQLLAQVTPYSESPVTTTFDLRGLSEAIKPLQEACKW
ncbi:type VI secretion system-associated protein TagO [Pokkaliibacter sp. MBI-7]|uniref:type VI secretion system-associated protein TagO n=1 Tax=Pokkaliibacter sp. MBI-7 TaxID=3040600 RepID=UPI00244CE2F3|nr:type VI secretion system-associated protein TagO [Pokkaliibacter sp. MBI-7]MDH2435597.1 type VI secretion system-associated protein TagO [Pokkaliibacter sp. MBI-7]